MSGVFGVAFIITLSTVSEPLVCLFVAEQNSTEMVVLATELVTYVWPLLLKAFCDALKIQAECDGKAIVFTGLGSIQ
jgi:hypothetical protein